MSRNIDQTKSVENSSTVSSRDDLSYVNHISNDSSNEQPLTKSVRRLSCTVCNLDFTNQKQFSSHLNSQLHQENQSIHDVLQSVAPEYRSIYKTMFTSEILNKKVFNRELRCYEQIKLIKEPLLGLNYIIEFQFENLTDPPQYICELCHCKCSLQAILLHLVNTEHQKKFLKNHHPDMYERVLSASHVRCEQQRLIENYAKQIQSRHGGPGNVQLHVQLEKLIGQKPVVLAVNYKLQSTSNSKGQNKVAIQLTSKTFQDYDYPYEDETNKGNKEFVSDQIVNNHEDSIQHGLTPEDLLYPFDRQFWYDNYKDLLESRPIDPHSVTYQEIIPEKDDLKPFQSIDKSDSSTIPKENLQITLENGQTIRRNHNQSSNRRVILESNRTTTITSNGSLRISPNKTSANFDGYALLNEQQKKNNGTNAVLNEQSARAILAASGLLRSDDEGEDDKDERTMKSKDKSDKTVSPAIAKRMLDAVLNGDLDVAHIQPYFSTFVNLIQSGQVELERHQAERLLHKVLVTSSTSPTLKVDSKINSNKRTRSDSYSKEYHSSSTRRQVYHDSEDYSSTRKSNYERHPSSSSSSTIATSTTRRVHLINENKPTNGK